MARYSGSQLRMDVRRIMLEFAAEARSNPETFDLVSPPSGRRAGVDAYTEVGGFSADAEAHVVTPLLDAFPGGATQSELA
ncbi:MAG: hypothetical protein KI792_00470 [Alphaproteobacteria bacterium]|nr:hypothetical protein [Alphaproteobacteria bacterium SS10]